MNKKMNKKEYEEKREILVNEIKENKEEMKEIEEILQDDPTSQYGEVWNFLHDSNYDIQVKIDNLDRDYERRNWNVQDYYMSDLASKNID